MVKKYLLDTNILIDLLKGNPKIEQIFDQIDLVDCDICSTVTAEFFQGFHKKRDIVMEKNWYEQLVSEGKMEVLAFDEKIAKNYAEIQIKYLKKGKPRPQFDLMIAATAMENNLELVTSNIKDFAEIEGLKVYRPRG